MIVGIDLGTTNSLIGIIEKGRPRLFNGEDNSPLIPSVVYLDPQDNVVVGAEAKKKRGLETNRTIYSAKRFIGRGAKDLFDPTSLLPFDFSPSDEHMVRFQLGGRAYTPIEISSFILRKLKALAESQSGQKVTKAVITVPAYFNDSQRQATKFAGELAGLEVARIINEPTAACLAYGLHKKAKGLVAVFDLGGGTFDISILSVKDGIFEVLATNGDTQLGGDDFDHAVVQALLFELRAAFGESLDKDPTARARLAVEAEQVKRTLTEDAATTFEFQWQGKVFSRSVTRDELNRWILPVLKRVEKPCQQSLQDAGLRPEQITDVILVGGSTRTPLVRSFVKEIFRREPICSLNPDEVVAMGATVQANVLAGQMGGILLLDVVPLSLGIETVGGVVSKLIHRNTTIPVSAAETFTTYVDGQTSVDIHVLQGERELVPDNRSLARFRLKGLPPMPAGIPKIEVEFIIDANGILSVKAAELRTGITTSITVNPTYGLTDNEVEQMLMAAYEFAESDFAARFVAEARTEADSLMRATKKSLEKGAHLLEPGEKENIEAALMNLQKVLGIEDHKKIREKIEELNGATRSFAERLLNSAVSDALKDTRLGEGTGRQP